MSLTLRIALIIVCVVIFVVIVKLFSLSLEVSFLKQKLKSTIQNVAIRQKELEDAGKGGPSDAKRDS